MDKHIPNSTKLTEKKVVVAQFATTMVKNVFKRKEKEMDTNKLPQIPEKYKEAVLYAQRTIRATGFFNEAIRISAEYYGLGFDELKVQVIKRQHAQKQRDRERKSRYEMEKMA